MVRCGGPAGGRSGRRSGYGHGANARAAVMAGPVVVMITCHDLGRHLGLYGRATVPSAHLDALGASGLVFDAAFCTAPHCSPARGSMSTGRYPHRNGLLGLAHPPYDFRLHPEALTTAAHLRAHGFGTHLFGLQHVAASAQAAGFATAHPYPGPAAIGADVAAQVEHFTRALPPGPLYIEINLEEPHRPYDQGGATPDDPASVAVPVFLPGRTSPGPRWPRCTEPSAMPTPP